VNSLPKIVTRQRRDCDLNPGPSAPESSTLTTRLPSHPKDGHEGFFRGTTQRLGAEGASAGDGTLYAQAVSADRRSIAAVEPRDANNHGAGCD